MTRTAKRKRSWKELFGFSRNSKTSGGNAGVKSRFGRQMAIDPLEERRLLTLQYTLTGLGDVAGGNFGSAATNITEAGVSTGGSFYDFTTVGPQDFNHFAATIFDPPNPIQDLGQFSADLSAYGNSINEAGYVVGRSSSTFPLSTTAPIFTTPVSGDRAVMWNPNTTSWTDLGNLSSDTFIASEALDINNSNMVVGMSNNGSVLRAFIWTDSGFPANPNTGMVPITSTGAFDPNAQSIAHGVTDGGLVFGEATKFSGDIVPFYYDTTDPLATMVEIDAGVIDAGLHEARILDVTETGFAVGQALYRSGATTVQVPVGWQLFDTNGFIADPDTVPLTPLLTEPGSSTTTGFGRAHGINEFGTVAGDAILTTGGFSFYATVWSLQRGTVDLNETIDPGLNWFLESARDINNSGQIVGYGRNASDDFEAFLLTPFNTAPTLDPISPDEFVVTEGVPFTLTITASDPDAVDNLTFSLSPGFPVGMSLNMVNPTTYELTWTPSASDPNNLAIEINVTDDGFQFLSDSQTIYFAIDRPVIFEEDFEGGATPLVWDFTNPGEGQAVVVNTLSVPGGSEALLLDSTGAPGGKDSAEAVLTLDLSAQTDAMLVFHQLEGTFGTSNDDENDVLPDVHTGAGLGDGVSISNDGITWYRLEDVRGEDINRAGDGLWMLHEYDLGANIDRINTEQGSTVVSFGSTFKIKWTQYDDRAFPLDGWAIDNIKIYDDAQFFDASLPGDVFHRVDSYDPNVFFRVAAFGNVDADTPILVSTHGTLREVLRHTTWWQQYIEDPSNGIDDVIVVAPFFPPDGPYDNYGDLSWDLTDSLTADKALLEIIDRITETGIGDGSELYMFGFSQGAGFTERFAAAHPDRVASAVFAGTDNHIFPNEVLTFPYGFTENPIRPVPDGITLDEQAFLENNFMLWVGQGDEFVTDISIQAQLQGFFRTHRSANMFEQMHDEVDNLGLLPADYNYEFFVQEGRGHLYEQSDIETFYEFLFSNFDPGPPIEVSPRVVLTPTVGETQLTLPAEDILIPETSDFWVEIWATSPDANGILDGSVTLAYDTSIMDAVEIQHSSLYGTGTTGTIDDANGRVRDIGGSTVSSGLGVGEHVLLARVRFTPETVGAFKVPIFAALQTGSDAFTLEVVGDPRTDLLPITRSEIDSLHDPPVLDEIPAQVVDEGNLLTFTATATDTELHNLTFTLGPGAPVGASIHPTTGVFTWTADNSMGSSFQLEVIVTDDGTPNKSDSQLVDVTVNLLAATADIGGPYSGDEGTLIALSGAGSSGATLYEWDLDNDGQYDDAVGVNPNFNATDNGVFTIGLRINGVGGPTDSTTVTVNNVAPTASISGTTAIYRGETVTFTLNAVDASPVDQAGLFDFEIDWDGNGSVDETLLGVPDGTTVMHTFPTTFSGNVQVRATDKDAATGSFSQLPIDVSTYVLRDDGFGNTDLIWGGTELLDAVFVFGSGAGLSLFVQFENLVPVNRLDAIGPGVTGKIIMHGYGFPDVLIAEFATGNSLELHGGDGDDVLAGGFLGDTLYGNAGNDVLLGGTQFIDGADHLFGGEGKDTLFGHWGADTLEGGAGEDLLMGDRFAFVDIPSAVLTIHNEWVSGRPYAERVTNIQGITNTGVNDDILSTGVTIAEDGDVDTLIGGLGEMDWFLYTFGEDILGDVIEPDEEETDTNL